MFKCGFSVVKETEVPMITAQLEKGRGLPEGQGLEPWGSQLSCSVSRPLDWTARLAGAEGFQRGSENHGTVFPPDSYRDM